MLWYFCVMAMQADLSVSLHHLHSIRFTMLCTSGHFIIVHTAYYCVPLGQDGL